MTAPPLPQQLGAPAFSLAQATADSAGGTSTITVTVAPDDLGPIVIRASMSPDGTRLEFFSTTDGGREALRQALPELRREASSSGLAATLDLGTGSPESGTGDGTSKDNDFDDNSSTAAGRRGGLSRSSEATATYPPASWAGRSQADSSTLDLFA